MLIQESELNTYNSDAIIDEAVILDESESITKLPAIPVIENTRLSCGLVYINDLDNIVEDYDCSYEDAFCAIAEQNELNPEDLAVVVEDYSIIETPELVDLIPNIVIKPISEDNIVYQAVNYCIDEYYDSGDEGYLDCLDEISDDLIIKAAGARYKKAKEMENYIYDKNNHKYLRSYGTDYKFDKSKAGSKNKKNYKLKKKFLKNKKKYDKVYDDYYFNSIDDDKLENKYKKRGLDTYDKINDYIFKKLMRNADNRLARQERERLQREEQKKNASTSSNTKSQSTSSGDNVEKSKNIATNRKEENQHTATITSSNQSTTSSSKQSSSSTVKHSSTASSDNTTTPILKKQQSSHITSPSPINTNSHNSFLSNHKKAIGIGAAGLVGAALAARKIAALRKQQQNNPGLRGKLQDIINRLKAKLHR